MYICIYKSEKNIQIEKKYGIIRVIPEEGIILIFLFSKEKK